MLELMGGGWKSAVAISAVASAAAALAFGAPPAQAQTTQPPVDLAISISDSPDPVQTNDPSFQYQFEVRNLSTLNVAYAVQAVFDIPHHVALPGQPPGGCYQPAGDKLVCQMGHIEPGGVRSRSIQVKHLLNGPIQFQGSVFSGVQNDPVPGNNTDFETTTVTGAQAPSWTVQVNRVGPGTVRGHGISCGIDFNPGLDCSEPFSEGGTATLRANDAENFVGWGGDCAFAGSNHVCSLPVTGNMNVDATFVSSQPPSAGFHIDRETGEPREMVMFDASNVVNAQTIEYKVDPPGPGGFKGGFTTSSLSPFTGMRLTAPGTYQVSQTVTGPGGVATAIKDITISGSTNFLGKPPPSVSFSSSDEALVKPGPAATQTCAINGQLVTGMAEAQGCFFHAADPEKLPAPERPIANEYWSLNQLYASLNQPECRNQDDLPAACAEAAAKQGIDIYYTRSAMMLNGMKVTPADGAAVVFYPALGRVVSSNAKVTFEGSAFPAFPAHNGPLNLDVGISDFTSTRKSLSLFTFNASDLPDIGGFKIDGQMSIALAQEGARRFSELAVNMTLPEEFSTSADTRPSGGVKLQSTNAEGIVLSNIDLDIPEAFLGGVRLSKLTLAYRRSGEPGKCSANWWKVTAEIFLIPASGKDGSGLSLAPPPDRNGIAFCDGGFHSGGGIFTFGEAEAPQIFPGVFLNTIEFNMQLRDPTVFSGAASVTAAKIVRAAGGLLVAFARPDAPYVIQAEDGGNTMGPLAGTRLLTTSFAVGGTVGIELPGEDNVLNLGNATALYSYPDYIKADGLARINTFLYTVEASGGFEANAATRRFDAFVRGNVCIAGGIEIEGVSACVAGEARVSSKGTSACLIIVDDGFEPGVGYAWGDPLPHIFNGITDGCKPSYYWEQNIRGARVAAQRMLAREAGPPAPVRGGAGTDPISFTVKPGDETKNVELHGVGGAPAVEITAPDGETITTVPNDMQIGEHLQTLAWEEYEYTWVSVTNGEPGEYLVTPLDGSVPIKEMFETRPTPDEGISATVEGSGEDRVLRYDVGVDPKQKVTFIERGDGIWNELGTATEGKGTIPFAPGPAPEGEREIIAQYEIDGVPGPVEVLDDYNAPPPPEAAATDGVKVKREGKKLTITWKKTDDAASYGVVVTQDDGVQKSKTVSAKKRSLKVGGISPIEAGTVSVSGIGPLGDVGSEDTGTFKAIKKKPDRRIPYSKLGQGGPEL